MPRYLSVIRHLLRQTPEVGCCAPPLLLLTRAEHRQHSLACARGAPLEANDLADPAHRQLSEQHTGGLNCQLWQLVRK